MCFMDRRRFTFLILFLIGSLILGFAIYRVFFGKPTATTPGTTPGEEIPGTTTGGFPEGGTGTRTSTPTSSGTLPPIGTTVRPGPDGTVTQPQIEQVTSDPILGVAADQDGRVQFYNTQDGKFYRLGNNGRPELLSDEVFYNVQNVTWAPGTTESSIIEYPDGSNIYYNFNTKTQVTLPKHWENFSFSSQGDKIAAKSIGYSPENRFLITSNPDGTEVSIIEPLGNNADKVRVDWSPNKQIVAFSGTGIPLGGDRQQILPIGLNGENFKGLIVEGRDFRSEWSPEGKKIIYSVYNAENNFKPQLWVDIAEGDAIGSGRKLLNVNTWADKCAFADERFVYCGVPEQLPTGAGFAPGLADNISDRLYRIDIQTGAKSELPLETPHVIQQIFLGPDGRSVYFTDKNETGVFRVPNL